MAPIHKKKKVLNKKNYTYINKYRLPCLLGISFQAFPHCNFISIIHSLNLTEMCYIVLYVISGYKMSYIGIWTFGHIAQPHLLQNVGGRTNLGLILTLMAKRKNEMLKYENASNGAFSQKEKVIKEKNNDANDQAKKLNLFFLFVLSLGHSHGYVFRERPAGTSISSQKKIKLNKKQKQKKTNHLGTLQGPRVPPVSLLHMAVWNSWSQTLDGTAALACSSFCLSLRANAELVGIFFNITFYHCCREYVPWQC